MKPILLLLLFILSSCVSTPTLKPFSSDGCSLFPDGNLKDRNLWCQCCVIHDVAYWQGGSEAQKAEADLTFRRCIEEKTKDPRFAEFMYQGVKYGGEPFFLNWYRWGYGWDYGRGYRALSEIEKQQVAEEMAKVEVLRCPE